MRHLKNSLILLACLALPGTFPVIGAPADRASDVHSGWTLLWSDEFDLPGAPDPDYWSHEVNCVGGGNNEHQCYTARLDNSYVDEQGFLHIVAKEEFFSGPSLWDDDPSYPGPDVSRNYTSARLRTKDKVDWLYGRIEVRAKVPGGRGMWPAIWMLPTDWEYGGWPASGEIDIMEAVNLPLGTYAGWGHFVHGTAHYGLPWPQWENHGKSHYTTVNPANDFHLYALEWEQDEIRWYYDGVQYLTQRSEGWYNYIWSGQESGFVVATDRAPFDQRFHLLLNVAVGGDWPGSPDSGWDADREMLVDYVRLYQCARGSVAGKGRTCGTIDPEVEVHEDIGTPGINDYVLYDDGFEFSLLPESSALPGVTVDSERKANGAWEIEFAQTGPLLGGDFLANVSLGSTDGFILSGGTSWTNNGEVEFDIKIKSIDPETRLFVKMDSGYPSVGSAEIEIPRKGAWHHVAVKIADLLANRNPGEAPLDLNNIQNLFVLESSGPAHVWVDNIHLQCAFNTEPEWWQIDKSCDLTARLSPEDLRAGGPTRSATPPHGNAFSPLPSAVSLRGRSRSGPARSTTGSAKQHR